LYDSLLIFYYYSSADNRTLHPFPTRRSSDLEVTHVDQVGDEEGGAPGVDQGGAQPPGPAGDVHRRKVHDSTVHDSTVHDSTVHRSEEHTSELQSPYDLVCRLLLEKKKKRKKK